MAGYKNSYRQVNYQIMIGSPALLPKLERSIFVIDNYQNNCIHITLHSLQSTPT